MHDAQLRALGWCTCNAHLTSSWSQDRRPSHILNFTYASTKRTRASNAVHVVQTRGMVGLIRATNECEFTFQDHGASTWSELSTLLGYGGEWHQQPPVQDDGRQRQHG